MRNILPVFMLLVFIAQPLCAEERASWQESRAYIEKQPWVVLSDDGINVALTSRHILAAKLFISDVLATCGDEDVRLLSHIANLTSQINTENGLSEDVALVGKTAQIQAVKCEISRMESGLPLSPRYSDREFKYYGEQTISPEATAQLEELDREHSVAKKARCDFSIKQNQYVWRNCYDVRPLDEVLSIVSTQKEIMGLPAITPDYELFGDRDPFAGSRYGVYRSIMMNPGGDAAAVQANNFSPIRYAYEIYNTFPADMEKCPDDLAARQHDGCFGKAEIYRGFQYYKKKMNANGFDVSKLSKSELLHIRMLEAGMIDEPDQPPSVEFAKYPPPLVPSWSEYFERDRYTAETGIILPEISLEETSAPKTIPQMEKAQVETPKAAPVTEVSQPPQPPQAVPLRERLTVIIIGILALLFGWYALRSERKLRGVPIREGFKPLPLSAKVVVVVAASTALMIPAAPLVDAVYESVLTGAFSEVFSMWELILIQMLFCLIPAAIVLLVPWGLLRAYRLGWGWGALLFGSFSFFGIQQVYAYLQGHILTLSAIHTFTALSILMLVALCMPGSINALRKRASDATRPAGFHWLQIAMPALVAGTMALMFVRTLPKFEILMVSNDVTEELRMVGNFVAGENQYRPEGDLSTRLYKVGGLPVSVAPQGGGDIVVTYSSKVYPGGSMRMIFRGGQLYKCQTSTIPDELINPNCVNCVCDTSSDTPESELTEAVSSSGEVDPYAVQEETLGMSQPKPSLPRLEVFMAMPPGQQRKILLWAGKDGSNEADMPALQTYAKALHQKYNGIDPSVLSSEEVALLVMLEEVDRILGSVSGPGLNPILQ